MNIWKSYIWTADKDYCLSSVHNCEDRFHIHVFIRSSNIWLSYIHSRLFTTSRVYLEPTQCPAPSWLVSSVGRALHRYRRGHGFKSRTDLNFFQAFFHYCFSSVHNCENRFHIQVFILRHSQENAPSSTILIRERCFSSFHESGTKEK